MSDHGEEGGGGGGHGAVWLVSYADMVTLLLAFFVVMYTMSQVDAVKLRKLVESMHSAFSPIGGDSGGVIASKKVKPGAGGLVLGNQLSPPGAVIGPSMGGRKGARGGSPAERSLTNVASRIDTIARQMKLSAQVKVKLGSRGLTISLEEATSSGSLVPFDSGSAQLTGGFRQLLDQLAPVLAQSPNKIEVQGHTDSRPISTAAYPSNWELSGARAGSVVRYLVGMRGLNPRQFVCAGFADTEPLAMGSTPEDWAHNRRIELVITRQPIDTYDQMTRTDAMTRPTDITTPLGRTIVAPALPIQPGEDAKPTPAPAEPAGSSVAEQAGSAVAQQADSTASNQAAATAPAGGR